MVNTFFWFMDKTEEGWRYMNAPDPKKTETTIICELQVLKTLDLPSVELMQRILERIKQNWDNDGEARHSNVKASNQWEPPVHWCECWYRRYPGGGACHTCSGWWCWHHRSSTIASSLCGPRQQKSHPSIQSQPAEIRPEGTWWPCIAGACRWPHSGSRPSLSVHSTLHWQRSSRKAAELCILLGDSVPLWHKISQQFRGDDRRVTEINIG